MKTIATIVTFNKVQLLKECIEAILNQETEVANIIIVDNGSTDGTREYLKDIQNDVIKTVFSEVNLGGAGGFNLAIKKAMEYTPDNIWVMDDDTIPERLALTNFNTAIKKLDGKFGFLSSNVLWTDRNPCLMNIPNPAKIWNSKSEKGLIALNSGSFVSMLINANVIKEVGYPITDFFIWGDDVEYSSRISKVKDSYFVSDSIAIHKMNENAEVNILLEDRPRIPRYYYDIRNRFYIAKKTSVKELFKYIFRTCFLLLKIIFKRNSFKFVKLKTVVKGFISGIFFNPKIETYVEK